MKIIKIGKNDEHIPAGEYIVKESIWLAPITAEIMNKIEKNPFYLNKIKKIINKYGEDINYSEIKDFYFEIGGEMPGGPSRAETDELWYYLIDMISLGLI